MTTALLPPGPRRKFLGSNLLEFRRDPTAFLTRVAREHGDVVYMKFGSQPIFMLNHPDLVKDVLVTHNKNFVKGRGLERAKRLLGEGLLTSEGSFHRRQRRLAQPAFHRQRIAGYADTMVAYADRAQSRWHEGQQTDVAEEMMQLTLAIVGKTLFDADVEGEAGAIGDALAQIIELFDVTTLPFAELLERLPLPSRRRFERARDRLDATIYRIVAERRASGEDRGDLLSMLLLAQDEEEGSGGMTDLQLRDEAMTIFLAGHETTANALAWTWYLLAQNPDVEAKLHAEIDAALGDRLPTIEDLARLPYAERVVAESMRLYPPAWIVGRRAVEDYRIGEYHVPARSIMLMSQFVAHRDARWFPDPETFDPERWTPEAKAALPKFAYFPFGGGPRQCVGEGFAWTESVLLLATIARRWRVRIEPGLQVGLQARITLRPKGRLPARLERRAD